MQTQSGKLFHIPDKRIFFLLRNPKNTTPPLLQLLIFFIHMSVPCTEAIGVVGKTVLSQICVFDYMNSLSPLRSTMSHLLCLFETSI